MSPSVRVSGDQPDSLVMALRVLWTSALIALATGVVATGSGVLPDGQTSSLPFVVFSFITTAFLLIQVSSRKNWARITLLVLGIPQTILSGIVGLFSVASLPLLGGLSLLQAFLIGTGMFLFLRRDTAAWFRP